MVRSSREEWKTYKNVFDNFTERTLFKLMGQKVIDGLEGPVKIGKESNVFTAASNRGRVIVKIYRLEGCNFNKMFDYIRKDKRYVNMKKSRRDIIFAWVQREYRNLLKAREAGVRVPAPYSFANNVIVMEMIGDTDPAPQLKDSMPKDGKKFLSALVTAMRKLYHGAGIVHGDLSEFNIINYNDNPVIIDFSQGTTVGSNNTETLLERDIKNIVRFFTRRGTITDEQKLLAKIKKGSTNLKNL